jgi:alkanesulfonate monooxygenase SsuD/methylene tetrahydromethanopterin reductase-like flavin-dependent oxidoreductase (luciferase family)
MLDNLPAMKKDAVRRPDGSIPTADELGRELCESYANNHVFGTPAQCLEKIRWVRDAVGAGEFIFMFRFADVSAAEAEASARLFAAEVLPHVQALDGPDRIEATPFADVKKSREHVSVVSA